MSRTATPSEAGSVRGLGARGATPKSDDPGPVKHGLSKEQRQEARTRRAEAAERGAKIATAGAAASRDLSAARVGVVRSALFDAQDWRREHDSRQSRMEGTFQRMYKPTASNYWTQKPEPQPRRPLVGALPAYAHALPAALSLAHPASREEPSDESDDEDYDAIEAAARAAPGADLAGFDPMAEPRRFYSEFRSRVAALRENVNGPVDAPMRTYMLPRAAEAVVAAANAPPPPPASEVPSSNDPEGTFLTGGVGILDEDFDVEPSLVYTDSAHYLADHGVQIPMWDELDSELNALELAHADAMNEVATRATTRPPMR